MREIESKQESEMKDRVPASLSSNDPKNAKQNQHRSDGNHGRPRTRPGECPGKTPDDEDDADDDIDDSAHQGIIDSAQLFASCWRNGYCVFRPRMLTDFNPWVLRYLENCELTPY
jgi:hypothetical protein